MHNFDMCRRYVILELYPKSQSQSKAKIDFASSNHKSYSKTPKRMIAK